MARSFVCLGDPLGSPEWGVVESMRNPTAGVFARRKSTKVSAGSRTDEDVDGAAVDEGYLALLRPGDDTRGRRQRQRSDDRAGQRHSWWSPRRTRLSLLPPCPAMSLDGSFLEAEVDVRPARVLFACPSADANELDCSVGDVRLAGVDALHTLTPFTRSGWRSGSSKDATSKAACHDPFSKGRLRRLEPRRETHRQC
jgi:hypothetical protein